MQVEVAPVPDNVQVVERKAPVLVCVQVIVPVGILDVPPDVSVTVAVQVDATLMPGVAGAQLIVTETLRNVTVTEALIVLALAP